jgi:putative transposase
MATTGALKRKNIRLPAERYLGRQIYFVTLCFHDRRRFGATVRLARWLVKGLQRHAAGCEFHVHAYCVMPDHMHVFAEGATGTSNLLKFIKSFKQETAVEFARRTHRRLWQFKYYDHILRRADSFESIAWYIWLNPVRKGLCRTPEDYPFAGSFTELGAGLLGESAAIEWTPPWKVPAMRRQEVERK